MQRHCLCLRRPQVSDGREGCPTLLCLGTCWWPLLDVGPGLGFRPPFSKAC